MDYRQLMQEKLDGQLDPDANEELLHHLAQDTEAAEQNAKLEELHDTLNRAPHVRAPQHLAATIMARLAKTIEKQANLKPLPMEIRMALMLSTSMITIAMMPVMMSASYMVVNLAYNPKILTQVAHRVIYLQVMMIEALVILLEEIEHMIRKDPESAPIAMALVPTALQGMVEYIQEDLKNNDMFGDLMGQYDGDTQQ